jgi:hypothetical protein
VPARRRVAATSVPDFLGERFAFVQRRSRGSQLQREGQAGDTCEHSGLSGESRKVKPPLRSLHLCSAWWDSNRIGRGDAFPPVCPSTPALDRSSDNQ